MSSITLTPANLPARPPVKAIERQQETRRKILVGAYYLKKAKQEDRYRSILTNKVDGRELNLCCRIKVLSVLNDFIFHLPKRPWDSLTICHGHCIRYKV